MKARSQEKHKPSGANRSVFHWDGLESLLGMDTEAIDLVVAEVPRSKKCGRAVIVLCFWRG